jgi:hypothetical protein
LALEYSRRQARTVDSLNAPEKLRFALGENIPFELLAVRLDDTALSPNVIKTSACFCRRCRPS